MTPHDVYATPMAPNHVLYTSYLWERAGVRERARGGARCTSKEGLSHGVAPQSHRLQQAYCTPDNTERTGIPLSTHADSPLPVYVLWNIAGWETRGFKSRSSGWARGAGRKAAPQEREKDTEVRKPDSVVAIVIDVGIVSPLSRTRRERTPEEEPKIHAVDIPIAVVVGVADVAKAVSVGVDLLGIRCDGAVVDLVQYPIAVAVE